MAEQKNILLLGDSRRMGYEPFVRKNLEGRANVYGPAENGRWAGYTLNSLRFWLHEFPAPDIVHWSCGLWDLGDDYNLGRPFSLPEEYESAVERTVIVLRKLFPGVKIIFGTTLPVGDQNTAGIESYNAIMARVAEKEGIPVDDTFSLMKGRMVEFDRGDGLHLNDEGNTILAAQVTHAIEQYL